MAVTERWKERKFGRSIDDKGVMSFTAQRVFDTDGPTDEIGAIDSVPDAAIGSGHPASNELGVSSNSAVEERKGLWAVTANYTTNPQGDSGSNGGDPNVTFGWEDGGETFAADTDIFGNPLFNSALDPFEGGWPRNISTGFYTVTIAQPFPFNAKEAASIRGRVFDDELVTPYGTFDALESKCVSVLPVEEDFPGKNRFKVKYRIEIRLKSEWPDMPQNMSPFDISFVDQGVHGWADTGKSVQIVEPTNPLVGKSARLNGEGIPFDSTDAKLYNNATPKGIGLPQGATKQERKNCILLYYFGCHRAKVAELNLPTHL